MGCDFELHFIESNYPMLTKEQERFILNQAYVPEHIPSMMAFLSGGDPILIDNRFLVLRRGNYMILVGYPLLPQENEKNLDFYIREILKKFAPTELFIISDRADSSFFKGCKKIEEDYYYVLEIESLSIPQRLLRVVERSTRDIIIRLEKKTSESHLRLTEEFLKRKALPEHIRELYIKFPEFIDISETTFYLSAYSKNGELAAYYVVESAARDFSAYIIGCTSKLHSVPHASDCLMYELINVSRESGKSFINLGLGVNEGISRFKEKWGAKRTLKYEAYHYRSFISLFYKIFRGAIKYV